MPNVASRYQRKIYVQYYKRNLIYFYIKYSQLWLMATKSNDLHFSHTAGMKYGCLCLNCLRLLASVLWWNGNNWLILLF